MERIAREEGLTVLGWRDTPIDGDAIGRHGARLAALHSSKSSSARPAGMNQDQLERKLYVVRKRAETELAALGHAGQGLLLHSVPVVAHHRL